MHLKNVFVMHIFLCYFYSHEVNNMQITTETIRVLNPCADRFDNYLEHYADFKGSVEDFAMLENITYNDKIWVLVRFMSHAQKVEFALKCASSVLDVFEAKYANDDRPRKALEAAEKWLNNPCKETRLAAADAYAAADAAAAYAAADAAAAYAAAGAAIAAIAADAAAAYAAAAAADAAAARAVGAAIAAIAADAVNTAKQQEELNLIFAVETLEAKKCLNP
jgi:hypothetical protein